MSEKIVSHDEQALSLSLEMADKLKDTAVEFLAKLEAAAYTNRDIDIIFFKAKSVVCCTGFQDLYGASTSKTRLKAIRALIEKTCTPEEKLEIADELRGDKRKLILPDNSLVNPLRRS